MLFHDVISVNMGNIKEVQTKEVLENVNFSQFGENLLSDFVML